MKQPLNTQIDGDKSAEIHHARDAAFDQLPDSIMVIHYRPRIGLQLFQTERNSLPLPIHVEHIDVHLIAHLEYLAGMLHPPPTQFRDVNQPVGTTQVHKGAKIGNAGDLSMPRLPFV